MNRISILRKQKGLSQTELGKLVGAAQNTVCNWESGSRQPDYETIIKLSKYFDVIINIYWALKLKNNQKN